MNAYFLCRVRIKTMRKQCQICSPGLRHCKSVNHNSHNNHRLFPIIKKIVPNNSNTCRWLLPERRASGRTKRPRRRLLPVANHRPRVTAPRNLLRRPWPRQCDNSRERKRRRPVLVPSTLDDRRKHKIWIRSMGHRRDFPPPILRFRLAAAAPARFTRTDDGLGPLRPETCARR